MVRVVCEGKSDRTFLQLLLKHLNFSCEDDNFLVMGNKSSLLNTKNEKYSMLISQVEVGKVTQILFLTDSDSIDNDTRYGGYENTLKSLKELLQELECEEISDFFIVCDAVSQKGYLESLILSTIKEEDKECIENFLECSDMQDKENHKKIINQIYKLHYPNSGYNFEHKNFQRLIEKLKKLFIEKGID